jgi:choice-of-anchor C domain-containing protein
VLTWINQWETPLKYCFRDRCNPLAGRESLTRLENRTSRRNFVPPNRAPDCRPLSPNGLFVGGSARPYAHRMRRVRVHIGLGTQSAGRRILGRDAMKISIGGLFRKSLSACAVMGFALGATTPVHAANLLQNGSFEAGYSGAPWETYTPTHSPGPTDHFAYWKIDFGQVDIINTLWDGSDADTLRNDASVDMNGSLGGGISQVFATTVGALYHVSFDIAGNYAGAPVTKHMDAKVAGVALPNAAIVSNHYTFNVTGKSATNMGWESRGFDFIATESSTRISFASTITGNAGMALDNVEVTLAAAAPVPEPETYAMMLAGLGLLGLVARRRRQKQAA